MNSMNGNSLEIRVQEKMCLLGHDKMLVVEIMGALERYQAKEIFEQEKDQTKTELTYEDWVVEKKLEQLLKNLEYAGQNCLTFVKDRRNWVWLRNIAIKCGCRDPHRQDELISEVLTKFLSTSHIEKYNPLRSTYQHHLFHAVKTTNYSIQEREKRNVLRKSVSIDTTLERDSTWEVSEDDALLSNKGSGELKSRDKGVLPHLVYEEMLVQFKDDLDRELPSVIAKSGKKTKMSEVWGWFWDKRLTLEEMCKEGEVEQSTMRRYFEKIRRHFMIFFGIDIPMRLWQRPEEREKYGYRENSEASRDAFIEKQLKTKPKEKEKDWGELLRQRWETQLKRWDKKRRENESVGRTEGPERVE